MRTTLDVWMFLRTLKFFPNLLTLEVLSPLEFLGNSNPDNAEGGSLRRPTIHQSIEESDILGSAGVKKRCWWSRVNNNWGQWRGYWRQAWEAPPAGQPGPEQDGSVRNG
jgi:hypothetical protein